MAREGSRAADRIRIEANDAPNARDCGGVVLQHQGVVARDDVMGRSCETMHRLESLKHIGDALEDREE